MPQYTLSVIQEWIAQSQNIVVLTGAGISTDSGIPDFRGPKGIWTLNPKAEQMSDIRYYISDPEVRCLAWQSRLAHPAWTAEPNVGHLALAELEQSGRLRALITQNIDGLHQRAGLTPQRVIEVHGSLHKVMCLTCQWRGPMQETLERVRQGDPDPACVHCGGLLKSDTISFGQPLAPEIVNAAAAAIDQCDLLMTVGTTLRVYPVAALVPRAIERGAKLVVLNAEPTAFDDAANAVLRESISAILPQICKAARLPSSFISE